MGPLTHIYISQKVTGKNDDFVNLGSVFPDIATTSLGKIDRIKIHDSPNLFSDFIVNKYPESKNFALGYQLHSPTNYGADFYSDDSQLGYAKIEGRKISQSVAQLLDIEDGEISIVLAHNFIELALDLHLTSQYPNLLIDYQNCLKEPIIQKILPSLSDYLKVDQKLLKNEFDNFINFLSPKFYQSLETVTQNIILKLIEFVFKKRASLGKALEITNQAVNITQPTYQEFLDETIRKIKDRELKRNLR